MRKLLMLAAVAAIVMSSVEVEAAGWRAVRPQVSSGGTSTFNRLMELERRKNAYLKKVILGR